VGSLSATLLLAQNALAANQAAIDITASNTANANTPGYTREVATWQEMDQVTLAGGQMVDGAQVTAVSQRDRVLQQRVDQQYQTQQQTATRLSALTNAQQIFSAGAGGSGSISTSINSFFSSLTQLAQNPTDGPTRTAALTAAQTLAASFNSASSQLSQQATTLNGQVSGITAQINGLTAQIASLNHQIMTQEPTETDAGTLEDQRQQDIYQLSQYIGLNQISTEQNGLTLTTTGGATLVSGAQSFALSTATVNGNTAVFSNATGTATDVTAGITGGTLGGTLAALSTDLPQIQSQLDTLAYGLAAQLNTVNTAGLDANGKPGGAIFSLPAAATTANPAGSAANISVALISASGFAAASTTEGTGGSTNANALAAVAQTAVANGQTATGFYASFIAALGSAVSTATDDNTSQTAVLSQTTSQNSALSGVSLDQEASNLTQYERSYEAASKLFTIIDEVLASVLNLGEQTTVS